MKLRMPLIQMLAGLGLIVCTGAVRAGITNLYSANFEFDAEGWLMVDLPEGGGVAGLAPLVWTHGPAGGRVQIADGSSGTIFSAAPARFLVALTNGYGSFLEFELATTHQTWLNDDTVVIRGTVDGQLRSAYSTLSRLPGPDWTPYSIRLTPDSFRLDSKLGPPIVGRQLRSLLRSAERVWLPAEFGAGLVETTQLRKVRLVAQEYLAVQCVPSVTLDGLPGQRFRLEYREAIGQSSWQTLTNLTLVNPPFVYFDMDALDGLQRFYRAVETP